MQLLDLPGIIEGAARGRGRGKEVIAVARTADLVLMVLDAGREQVNNHRRILEEELEIVGMRLNKRPPQVHFVKKKTGGVKLNSTCPLTKLGDNPLESVRQILSEYKIHNVEMLIREDVTQDEVIDVVLGNRKYVRCLYAYNKIDQITIEQVDALAREPNSVVMSVHARLNLDELLARMWEYMGLIRMYTKKKGAPPDLLDPVILSTQRHGVTVEAGVSQISKELVAVFNYSMVWGRSTKHSPQRVGLAHVLCDEDVLQVVPKTVAQQKLSKDYSKRVEAYNKKTAEVRRARTKEGKKKRTTG